MHRRFTHYCMRLSPYSSTTARRSKELTGKRSTLKRISGITSIKTSTHTDGVRIWWWTRMTGGGMGWWRSLGCDVLCWWRDDGWQLTLADCTHFIFPVRKTKFAQASKLLAFYLTLAHIFLRNISHCHQSILHYIFTFPGWKG